MWQQGGTKSTGLPCDGCGLWGQDEFSCGQIGLQEKRMALANAW